MSTIPTPSAARSRVASLTSFKAEPEEITEARRMLAVANIHRTIREQFQKYPVPTQQQRAELAALLLSGNPDGLA